MGSLCILYFLYTTWISTLYDLIFLFHSLIELISARKIKAGKTILRQNAARKVTAKSNLTIYIDRLASIQFLQMFPQIIQWNCRTFPLSRFSII